MGTDVPSAFLASLNADVHLSVGSYGIHGVPHVGKRFSRCSSYHDCSALGVYGDSYTIALPMILLALPTSFG